jgi:ABC-2 type transport system ATP-binding protein
MPKDYNKNLNISFDSVAKSFFGLKAVKNVSFSLDKSKIYGLLGKNGAGKTTSLKILSGMHKPTSGEVRITFNNKSYNIDQFRMHIAYLAENVPLYEEMRVESFLKFMCAINNIPKKEIDSRVNKALSETSCEEFAKSPISKLSKGMKQRVGIAGVLCYDPELIILDEPLNGLDPFSIKEIKSLIKRLGKDKMVIISSHRLSEVVNLCDEFLILDEGELIFNGKIQDLLQLPEDQQNESLNLWADELGDQTFSKVNSIPSIDHSFNRNMKSKFKDTSSHKEVRS